jgi:hypothetical protein
VPVEDEGDEYEYINVVELQEREEKKKGIAL